MSTSRNLQDGHPERGTGPAPLFIGGLAAGLAGAASAQFLGAGWPIVLLTYWLAGTTGLLGSAALAAGAILVPRPRPKPNVGPGCELALARARR